MVCCGPPFDRPLLLMQQVIVMIVIWVRPDTGETCRDGRGWEPAFGQQLLDIAVAQREAEIEPDRALDDLGREAMADECRLPIHLEIHENSCRLDTGWRLSTVCQLPG